MKSFLRINLAAIVVVLFFNAFSATEAKAQGPLNEVLNRMDAHYKALKSLKASIRREQYNSQLQESDVSQGEITLLPGSGRNFSLRLDWTKPRPETLSVVNGQYVAYIPGIKRAYTGSAESKNVGEKGGNVLKIMSMSKEELKANYVVQYIGQENVAGGTPTWHLKLTPRNAASYKFAELWVDGNGMPIQGKVTLPNNDTDGAILSNLEKNVKIKASIFSVNPPKGTQIVAG